MTYTHEYLSSGLLTRSELLRVLDSHGIEFYHLEDSFDKFIAANFPVPEQEDPFMEYSWATFNWRGPFGEIDVELAPVSTPQGMLYSLKKVIDRSVRP